MNYLEIIAVVSTIICVLLTTKQHVSCWIFGIIGESAIIVSFFNEHVYAQLLLHGIFLIQCFIGLYNWKKKDSLKVSNILVSNMIVHIGFAIGLGIIYGLYVHFIEHTYIITTITDGIIAAIGALGNMYLIKKRLQSWLLFMTYNILAVFFLYSIELYLLSVLNVILFIISLNGYLSWKRSIRTV